MFQDIFQLHTPGGGGYGLEEDWQDERNEDEKGKTAPGTYVKRGSVFEYTQGPESV